MNAELHEAPDPVPPGFWMTILGVVLAVFAPLAGFLGASTTGATLKGDTMGIWLIVGLVIGGLGVLGAFTGAQRWWRATH